jgi:hypothetical protein
LSARLTQALIGGRVAWRLLFGLLLGASVFWRLFFPQRVAFCCVPLS